jgi:hypothetical protein
MSSKAADIATAITSQLNAGTFVESFTAVRKWNPNWSIPAGDLTDGLPRVTVAPTTLGTAQQSRGGKARFDFVTEIGVQKQILTDPDDVDSLIELAEQIRSFFTAGATFGTTGASLAKSPELLDDLVNIDQIRTANFATAVVRITTALIA